MQNITDYIEKNETRFIRELTELIAIPSVSTKPENKKYITQCVDYLSDHFKKIGMEKVEVHRTKGNPILYAEWMKAPGQPTLLLYGHYDVQPEDPIEPWETPPFKLTLKNGNLYGRGATDNKGQFFVHLKALESRLQTEGKLPVNVKFILEGEEEIGGESLNTFIKKNREKLKADVILISDGPMYAKNVPAVDYRLRGGVFLEVTVKGPKQDLHSGEFGGPVMNPINALAGIIAKLHDANGKIAIPGFYEDVLPPSAEELEKLKELHVDEAALKEETGVSEFAGGEKTVPPFERIWFRPSLDVSGIIGGYTHEGFKGVVPPKAVAKIGIRLVPNQDPDKIQNLTLAYLRKVTPPGTTVDIRPHHNVKPVHLDIRNPSIQAVEKAWEKALDRKPVFTISGGSLPVVATFKEELGVEAILTGFGKPGENMHGPNEHLDLEHFRKGILFSVNLLEELKK